MNNSSFLSFPVEDKTIAWLASNNDYIILENTTANIVAQLYDQIEEEDIATSLSKELSVPYKESLEFVIQIKQQFFVSNSKNTIAEQTIPQSFDKPKDWDFIKLYAIDERVYQVKFENEALLSFIHPKFAHLEVDNTSITESVFEVFYIDDIIAFTIDNQWIGSWSEENVHYFQGKFSMELIQKIHHKPEEDWIAIFHASAVSNGNKSILFLGDSGNGKSTSLALLQANGYSCLADDFVPFAKINQHVYAFPSAISIKKNSLPILLPIYPSLANAAEFYFESLQKTVRYLPPNATNFATHLSCKELIFIKYKKNHPTKFSKISKLKAFEKLIPDSWISQQHENVAVFLEWFSSVTCYELIYSNNEEMIETVHNLFSNEL